MAGNREVQMISIERNDAYRQRNRQYVNHRYARERRNDPRMIRRQKRRRKQKMLLIRIFLSIVLLAGLCYTAVHYDIGDLFGKKAKIERLKKSDEYPKELIELVKKNEETYDFVKDYPNRETYQKATLDISKDVKKGKVPLLMQWDKRWGYDAYGDAMIALSGCGPTCMTMAYLYHTGDTSMNPKKMAEYAQDNGYHTDEGTSWTFWTDGAAGLGLYGEEISLNESTIDAVLDCGGLVVCSMAPGDFTDTGHYILLRGYDSKGYFVNDPNHRSNSKKQWMFDTLSGQIKNLWAIYGQ